MQIPILHENRFYVYEHIRVDTREIFYVGKGTGRRAYVDSKHSRSKFWQRVVEKSGGFLVRVIADSMPEELAFLVEKERIHQLRSIGVVLCNLTDGGDGTSGYVRSEELRKRVGDAHRGKKIPPEVRAKISASVKAAGYRHSKETIERIAQMNKGHLWNVGRVHPEHERKKRAASLIGNKSRTGQKRSKAECLATSIAMKGRPQALQKCPHCSVIGGNAMKRWHFENCKLKKHDSNTYS